MTMNRVPRAALLLAGLALALTACTEPAPAPTASAASGAAAPSGPPTASSASTPGSAVEPLGERLPLTGALTGLSADAAGQVSIDRREDGTVWVTLTGVTVTPAYDPFLLLSERSFAVDSPRPPDILGTVLGPLTAESEQSFPVPDDALASPVRSLVVLGTGDPGTSRLAAATF
ncbi:hypothetical protein NB037_15405 [Rathayibacter sp. ZW T2_19]|uniref:DM13 domain-containing protein n=1 Tax=Rathayibacter rubneri TaxID=2950106 RepID=A0A9X2DZ66_9MICO|nr:hypothetical protein [Rathayibacter rubneri]MCM6763805.1 hypothetical protein [Rathayibacter rubneri]